MNEKKLTLEDAFQVWWFVFWRTVLAIIGINIVLKLLIHFLQIPIGDLAGTISLIISIIVQVFFIKSAINKDYKEFRLSANLLSKPTKNGNE